MFKSIQEIRKANIDAGSEWFSRTNMRLFGSRVHSEVYGYGFFVTSEQGWIPENREYSVRVLDTASDVERLFTTSSRSEAHALAKKLGNLVDDDQAFEIWFSLVDLFKDETDELISKAETANALKA